MKTLLLLVAPVLLLAAGCAGAPPAAPPPSPEAPTLPGAPGETSAEPFPDDASAPVEIVLTPGEYLARSRGLVEEAQSIRSGTGGGGPFSWLVEAEGYRDLYTGAQQELNALLEHHPGSPQASEAQFMLGEINDYPHLNNFEEALDAYRLTTARYPGTEAARRAARRIAVLEEIMRGLTGSSHDKR